MKGRKEIEEPAGKGGDRASDERPYHHGSLHQALIDATDALLVERGVEGFTLREAARRAGVSPSAPAHHFGSAAGLLTEVAILAHRELAEEMAAAVARSGDDPQACLHAMGVGYVRFALAHPGRFRLMFGSKEKLLADDERLQAAAQASLADLERVVRACLDQPSDRPLDRKAVAALLGVWSVVHGFAQLALEGRIGRVGTKFGLVEDAEAAERLPEAILPDLLAAMLPPRRL